MGIFDAIKGAFNPQTVAIYNDLINNHKEAFRRWRGTQKAGTLSKYFDFRPTFSDKQYIANHQEDILAFESIITEEKAYFKRRQLVIDAASKYPMAFRSLVIKLNLPNIPEVSATLPGERKSKRTKRIENEARKCRQSHLTTSSRYNNRIQSIISNTPFPRTEQKRSLLTLKKEEYESLYSHLSELPSEENKLKKQLIQEDYLFSFEDNILDNEKRQKYYKAFLSENGRKDADYEFLATHLNQLDVFIRLQIEIQYEELLRNFALGVREYQASFVYGDSESELDKKDRILNNKDKVIQLDAAKRKYNELKRKYPKGLPAFEQFYSYDNSRNSAELTWEEIFEHEEEIANFEKFADSHSSFIKWQQDQREFASLSRSLKPKNFGCYFYNVPITGIKADGTETSGDYRVWQLFYTSFFDVPHGSTISEEFTYLSNRAAENPNFLTGNWNYKTSVYDVILDLINNFKSKVGDISIVFGSNGLESDYRLVFNHSKFKYLISKLDEAAIPYYEIEADIFPDNLELTKHIIIFEFISTNPRLRQTVERLHKQFALMQPLISYVSLRKGYDCLEVKELEAKKEKQKHTEVEAEKKRIQEEKERKAREEAQRQELIRKKREDEKDKRLFLSKVLGWHILGSSFHYAYLLKYFPTTCDFDATEDEWEDRWTVWNFKNTPGKTSPNDHRQALNTVIPRLKSLLLNTFGIELLHRITLVCIPASSAVKTQARYETFSTRICRETGMINAYSYIHVISSSSEKKFGGSGISTNNVTFDNNFFKGRYVLLFDDIITKGDSMLRFKRKLEELGAIVIGGLSIGKTTHSR